MTRFAFALAVLITLAGCRQEARLTAPNDGENAMPATVENTSRP
jgi:predicted small lipoprotein YifL